MTDKAHHDHVRLRDAFGASVTEMVPAQPLEEGRYTVLGTPGLIHGCAAGDEVVVDHDGVFVVVRRGGNVAVHVYARSAIDADGLADLRERFSRLGGTVEAPPSAQFAVVTVPVDAGFPAIEAAVEAWVGTVDDVEWSFGNVYDQDDQPPNWWLDASG